MSRWGEVDTDGALIERFCRGRPDAFTEVVRRHEVAVDGFLARRAGRDAAADLLAEVWLRAFAGCGGYDPGRQDARPWLYGIARNVLRAHRGGRMTTGDDATPRENDLDLVAAIGRVGPPDPDVLAAAREVLWSAVAQEMLSAAPAERRPGATGEQRAGPRRREQPGP